MSSPGGSVVLKGSGVTGMAGAIGCQLPLDLSVLFNTVEEAAAAVAEFRSGKGSRRARHNATGDRAHDGCAAHFFELVVVMFPLVAAFDFGFSARLGCQVVVLRARGKCASGRKNCADEDCMPSMLHRNPPFTES